jgi:WD40 repeat protein
MVDYYSNGKNQLLFSGKNYLHLLDRNGNYVERYPIKLRSPASGPPALFDYDNNQEYRLIIPGEDKLIYEYDIRGNVVKGWKPFRTNGIVRAEVRFFRVSGKDYIVASDNNTVYFLDRTGNIKLRLKEPVSRARGSEIRLTQGADQMLVFSSPEGVLQFVSFDGTVKKVELNKFSVDHTFDFFDVEGDGFGEYIFIDKGILYLYDHNKSEIFRRDFNTDQLSGPINFIFSASDRKIGVFDNRKKLIYLIDKKGNNMKGFPLRGASMFSIGKFSEKNEFHLIVGGENNFLYDYKVSTQNE